jgi:hypothetical protein
VPSRRQESESANDSRQGEARPTTREWKSERLTARRGPADDRRVKERMTHGKARPGRRQESGRVNDSRQGEARPTTRE